MNIGEDANDEKNGDRKKAGVNYRGGKFATGRKMRGGQMSDRESQRRL